MGCLRVALFRCQLPATSWRCRKLFMQIILIKSHFSASGNRAIAAARR